MKKTKTYYRFMSLNEFSKLTAGCILESDNKFKTFRTDSEGFCFLAEKTEIDGLNGCYFFDPLSCLEFLSGIVSKDILVKFETKLELTESCGVYADPTTDEWGDTIDIKEYCISKYDIETMKPVAYTMDTDRWIKNKKWYLCNY